MQVDEFDRDDATVLIIGKNSRAIESFLGVFYIRIKELDAEDIPSGSYLSDMISNTS